MDKIWDVLLIQVFPIPRITTISVVLLPENFEATDSLISEHSAPETQGMGTTHPDDLIYQLELPPRRSRLDVHYSKYILFTSGSRMSSSGSNFIFLRHSDILCP